jgi:hypothetical protein
VLIRALTLAIQAFIDAITLAIETLLDAVALAVEPIFKLPLGQGGARGQAQTCSHHNQIQTQPAHF